jgi:6 kDa early secretory antigenic target
MADGSFTSVDFSAMETAEGQYASIVGAFETTVNDLLTQLGTNLSEWIGTAQTQYHTVQQQWTVVQGDIQQTFTALQNVIGTANQNYQTTERANASSWGAH